MGEMDETPDIDDMPDTVENLVSRRETMVMEDAEVSTRPIDRI